MRKQTKPTTKPAPRKPYSIMNGLGMGKLGEGWKRLANEDAISQSNSREANEAWLRRGNS